MFTKSIDLHIFSKFVFIFISLESVEVTQGEDDRQLDCDVMEPWSLAPALTPRLASLVAISQRHSSVSRGSITPRDMASHRHIKSVTAAQFRVAARSNVAMG